MFVLLLERNIFYDVNFRIEISRVIFEFLKSQTFEKVKFKVCRNSAGIGTSGQYGPIIYHVITLAEEYQNRILSDQSATRSVEYGTEKENVA